MTLSEVLSHFDNPAIIGSICVLLGGVLNQIFVNRSKIQENQHKLQTFEQADGVALRKELLERYRESMERCERLENSNSEWQKRYYEETSVLKTKIAMMEAELKAMAFKLSELAARSQVIP